MEIVFHTTFLESDKDVEQSGESGLCVSNYEYDHLTTSAMVTTASSTHTKPSLISVYRSIILIKKLFFTLRCILHIEE